MHPAVFVGSLPLDHTKHAIFFVPCNRALLLGWSDSFSLGAPTMSTRRICLIHSSNYLHLVQSDPSTKEKPNCDDDRLVPVLRFGNGGAVPPSVQL